MVKPIAGSVRVLIATLIALVWFASLDQIPDPPSVLTEQPHHAAKAHSLVHLQKVLGPSAEAYEFSSPVLFLLSAVPVACIVPDLGNGKLWYAADSSPPRASVLFVV